MIIIVIASHTFRETLELVFSLHSKFSARLYIHPINFALGAKFEVHNIQGLNEGNCLIHLLASKAI